VLAALDPDLDSVLNVNTPADYQAARRRPAPEVTVELSGALAEAAEAARPGRPRSVRAATLQAAVAASGLPSGWPVTAAVNGGQATRDLADPLAAGDAVFLAPAGVVAGDNAGPGRLGAIPSAARVTPGNDGLAGGPDIR
jgi:molybdopterin-guanine dinucleotide biosynthesis protein A